MTDWRPRTAQSGPAIERLGGYPYAELIFSPDPSEGVATILAEFTLVCRQSMVDALCAPLVRSDVLTGPT
jgi:hypothetical protein